MGNRGSHPVGAQSPPTPTQRAEKKTPSGHRLIQQWDRIWALTRPAFRQQRTFRRARRLALAALVGLGRRNITGMLTASGQQFTDWSAAYRLFACDRIDPEALSAPLRRGVVEQLAPTEPLVALLDDTHLPKRGRKIAQTGWIRDPLGPKFQTNLVWGQRMVQLSLALPEAAGPARARGIPADLRLCPRPRKPRKGSSAERWQAYHRLRETSRPTLIAADQIARLRRQMDQDGQRRRPLIVSGDGGFTNTTTIKSLPERTVLVGRLRKDAKLYGPPLADQQARRGRKRVYGEPLPTPEQLHGDPGIPWQQVTAVIAGESVKLKAKRIGPVRWRGAGARDLCLVIIQPRAEFADGELHRVWHKPVYLICTASGLDSARIVQSFLWRWEIELNFRDQKTLLGMGQAQVRSAAACERVAQLIATAYGVLHLAVAGSQRAAGQPRQALPRPRWRKERTHERCTTGQAISLLRDQLWGRALGVENLSDFVRTTPALTKCEKFTSHLASSLIYSTG